MKRRGREAVFTSNDSDSRRDTSGVDFHGSIDSNFDDARLIETFAQVVAQPPNFRIMRRRKLDTNQPPGIVRSQPRVRS